MFASCPNFPVDNCCHFPTVRTFLTFQFNRFHIISHIFTIFHIISQHFTTFHNYRNMFLSSFSVPNCIPGPKRATPHWLEPPRRDPSAATSWAPARGVLRGLKKRQRKNGGMSCVYLCLKFWVVDRKNKLWKIPDLTPGRPNLVQHLGTAQVETTRKTRKRLHWDGATMLGNTMYIEYLI
jgi:hypothetical protein